MNQVGLNSGKILNFKNVQQMQMQQYPQMQFEQPPVDVQIPQIYQVASKPKKEGFKEQVKKWDMMGLLYPWLEHPFMMLGTCAGLAWGVDKFSSSCGGQYETSLVGKAARLGDNIQESKFVQSKPFQTVLGWGKSIKDKFNHVFRNSDVINAIKHTPSTPEWAFVKDELLTMEQRVVHDFTRVTDTLLFPENKDGSRYIKLENLGVNKKENEFITKFFKGIPQTEESISNAIQLKRLGLTDDAIQQVLSKAEATELVKAKYFEKLGIDEEFLQKLKKNPATKEDILKVKEACKKANGIKIGAGYQKWLGKFQPIARTIGLDEVGNRLMSMSEAKTKLGRAFATFLQKCHRGFTFGGGKGGVLLFVSPLLVETMLDVKKADPDQKIGTAAHGLVHSVSWVFTFPLALSLLHRIGGMQYAGMSKEAVEECRTLIKEFNEKANPYKECGFLDKLLGRAEKKAATETFQTIGDYNKAKEALTKRLKELRTVKDQNLLTKICKKVGSFLTMDLECISSFKNGGFFGGGFKNIANKLKNIAGVPLRVGIWAGITMGILDPLINKGIKSCFGNFYDRFKEEEFEGNKKTQKQFLKEDLQARLKEAQRQKVMGSAGNSAPEFEVPQGIQQVLQEEQIKAKMEQMAKSKTSELNKETIAPPKSPEEVSEKQNVNEVATKQEKTAEQTQPAQDAVTQAPNEVLKTAIAKEEITKDTNTYIPSSKPANAKPIENVKRDNYTYIPSSENVIPKNEKDTEVNKYIPSQQGSQFTKTFDNSGLEAALRRADRAEQRALQTLAGNFNNY